MLDIVGLGSHLLFLIPQSSIYAKFKDTTNRQPVAPSLTLGRDSVEAECRFLRSPGFFCSTPCLALPANLANFLARGSSIGNLAAAFSAKIE